VFRTSREVEVSNLLVPYLPVLWFDPQRHP
jgi:hypothetical protein